MLDNESNQPSKFRAKNRVEINDQSRGTYTGSHIKFMTTMLRSDLCDYADAYTLVKGRITITGVGDNADSRRADERNKSVVFKNFVPFAKCMSRISNIDTDNAPKISIL